MAPFALCLRSNPAELQRRNERNAKKKSSAAWAHDQMQGHLHRTVKPGGVTKISFRILRSRTAQHRVSRVQTHTISQ